MLQAQFTLQLNDLKRALTCFVVSLSACHSVCAQAGHDWKVSTGKQGVIEVDGNPIRIGRTLKTTLRKVEAAAFLPLDFGGGPLQSWRWLLVREASRARGDVGFCGAGHEDHLLLIKVTKSVGIAVDDLLAQSCLKSISMDMDQFNELTGAISIDEQARRLSLQQTVSSDTDSFRQDVRIEVTSGRMNVAVRKVAD